MCRWGATNDRYSSSAIAMSRYSGGLVFLKQLALFLGVLPALYSYTVDELLKGKLLSVESWTCDVSVGLSH